MLKVQKSWVFVAVGAGKRFFLLDFCCELLGGPRVGCESRGFLLWGVLFGAAPCVALQRGYCKSWGDYVCGGVRLFLISAQVLGLCRIASQDASCFFGREGGREKEKVAR